MRSTKSNMKAHYSLRVALHLVIFVFLFSTFSFSQHDGSYAEEINTIEDFVSKELKRLNLPSISIGFYKDDFVWSKSFGYADIEHKVPAQSDTLYRMASISKPMTAVGILKLMEDGKLNLDDEVQKHVPYFPRKRWPITIRYLLGHLSGISHYRNYDEEGHIKTHYTTEQSIGVFKDWELEAEPGTKYIYTTYGYNLLGAVIEGASGLPYSKYMRENVWKPLGMNDTRMDIADDIIGRRARGYRKEDDQLVNCEFVDISSRFAGGGIMSTVNDLINLARSLDEGNVLSPDTQMMMYESMVTREGRLTGYGMGWGINVIQGFWNVAHSGGQQGTSTYLLRFPKEKFAVAVTCNAQSQDMSRYALLVSSLVIGAYPYRLETPSSDVYRLLRSTFFLGLGFHSKFGETLAETDEDLDAGFNYFNSLDFSDEKIDEKISNGAEIFTGAPLIKVGTYMAEKIREKFGEDQLYELRRSGSLPFFKTYIDLYKADESIPAEYRFTTDLENIVNEWYASYLRTWSDETRMYFHIPIVDIGSYIETIKNKFAGETVYPLLNDLFNTYAYYLKQNDKLDEGLAALMTAIELYPNDANLYDSAGEFFLEKKDKAKAIEYYEKALEVDPEYSSSIQALEKLKEKPSLVDRIKCARVKQSEEK